MRSRYEKAKVAKALGDRRRLLNSNPPIDWEWVDHMMKILWGGQVPKSNEYQIGRGVKKWCCPFCSDTVLIPRKGRPRIACKPCLQLGVVKAARQAVKRKRRGGSGRGNIKPRPCGCPARQHKPGCPLSRPFGGRLDEHQRISRANARKIKRREREAEKRKAAIVYTVSKYNMREIPPAMFSMPIFLQCVKCRGRGPVKAFAQWDGKGQGICQDC